jgi:hypothetical protein
VVAFYGLGKIAELSVDKFGEDVSTYVERDIYVGDGLTLLPTETEAVEFGFWGWYTPNIGKYQVFFLSSGGGTNSACSVLSMSFSSDTSCHHDSC